MFLVTGASGFVGRAVTKNLENRNIPYIAVKHDHNLEALVIDRDELSAVIHLAAHARYRERSKNKLLKGNVTFTRRLLDAVAESSNGPIFVFASTIGVLDRRYGEVSSGPLTSTSSPAPQSHYGESKLQAELLIKQSDLPCAIVRLPWIYGDGMRPDSHLRFLHGLPKLVRTVGGQITRGRVSVLSVADAADVLVEAAVQQVNAGVFMPAERLPVALKNVLRHELDISQVQPSFLPGSTLTSRLPFNVRVLLEDALVVEPNTANQIGWSPAQSFQDWSP